MMILNCVPIYLYIYRNTIQTNRNENDYIYIHAHTHTTKKTKIKSKTIMIIIHQIKPIGNHLSFLFIHTILTFCTCIYIFIHVKNVEIVWMNRNDNDYVLIDWLNFYWLLLKPLSFTITIIVSVLGKK